MSFCFLMVIFQNILNVVVDDKSGGSSVSMTVSEEEQEMDIELVEAELQIRKNSNIPCAHFYDFLLTQEELLKKIGSNGKFIRKNVFLINEL